MDVFQAAEQAWDQFVGRGMPEEMMAGHNTPDEAIDTYCNDWPWHDSDPDEELDDLGGYTARQLLVIYLEQFLEGD